VKALQKFYVEKNSDIKYTVSGKNILNIFDRSLKTLSDFNNFWQKYFWYNWPSNDRLICHRTQCLLLHYLEKTEPTKYCIFVQKGIII